MLFHCTDADVERADRAGPSGQWASRLTVIWFSSRKVFHLRDEVKGKASGIYFSLLYGRRI